MTTPEICVAIAGVVAVVSQLLDHLRTRKPTQEVNDKLDDHAGRIAALESWKNS